LDDVVECATAVEQRDEPARVFLEGLAQTGREGRRGQNGGEMRLARADVPSSASSGPRSQTA
jgi:hypothetical protein